jgi:hypothetical protein
MTATVRLSPGSVRENHPDWWVWQLGNRWWAMHQHMLVPGTENTLKTANGDTLEELDEVLTEADA